MSDRLAVMRDGLVEQVGTPEEVYSAPATAYVAGFLGSANVLDVEVARRRRRRRWPAGSGRFALRAIGRRDSRARARCIVRPERIALAARRHRDTPPTRPTTSSTAWSTASSTSVPTTHVVRAAGRRPDAAGGGAEHRRRRPPRRTPWEPRFEPTFAPRPPAARHAGDAPADAGAPVADDRDVSGRDASALTPRRLPARRRGRQRPPARRPRSASRSRRRGRGRRPGPRARPGSTSPSSRAAKVIANAVGVDRRRARRAAWPSRTTSAMVSRQRWSSSMRSFATRGAGTPAPRGRTTGPRHPAISSSPCGTQVSRTSSSSRSRAVVRSRAAARRRRRRRGPRRSAAPR